MGGYYGSPDSVMKNNKAQRRTSRNQREWKDYIGIKEVQTDDFIKATPELLATIRLKYRKERRNKIIYQIVFGILSISIIIFLFYFISTWNRFK